MLENPVAPHNLMESADALFNLCVKIRSTAKKANANHDNYVRYAGKLEDMVVAYGQEIYQQRDLNDFYRTLGLDGLDKFVDSVEENMSKTRRAIHALMDLADRLCEAYVNQTPFKQYHETDEELDRHCRQAYIWVATQQDMHCGYDIKDLIFTKTPAAQ